MTEILANIALICVLISLLIVVTVTVYSLCKVSSIQSRMEEEAYQKCLKKKEKESKEDNLS